MLAIIVQYAWEVMVNFSFLEQMGFFSFFMNAYLTRKLWYSKSSVYHLSAFSWNQSYYTLSCCFGLFNQKSSFNFKKKNPLILPFHFYIWRLMHFLDCFTSFSKDFSHVTIVTVPCQPKITYHHGPTRFFDCLDVYIYTGIKEKSWKFISWTV